MIIETLVTTETTKRELNVAPMGASIDCHPFTQFELRPFKTSQTFSNLFETKQGVLHFTDDASLIALAALELELPALELNEATQVTGKLLATSCRAFEFQVVHCDVVDQRTSMICRVVEEHRFREFEGLNRARAALVEAAVLASRIDFIPFDQIHDQVQQLEKIVERTGGELEKQTIQSVCQFVSDRAPTVNSRGLQ